MGPEQRVSDHFNASAATAVATSEIISNQIAKAASLAVQILETGGKILICGNGGSASDAQHFASELICRYEKERRPLAAMALTADSSVITATGNDYDFTQIFSRQIRALAHTGDLLIAITTSGNSANVIQAVESAIEMEIQVIALTGKDGGRLALAIENTGLELRVPSSITARIQEAHAIIIHCICDLIELQVTSTMSQAS